MSDSNLPIPVKRCDPATTAAVLCRVYLAFARFVFVSLVLGLLILALVVGLLPERELPALQRKAWLAIALVVTGLGFLGSVIIRLCLARLLRSAQTWPDYLNRASGIMIGTSFACACGALFALALEMIAPYRAWGLACIAVTFVAMGLQWPSFKRIHRLWLRHLRDDAVRPCLPDTPSYTYKPAKDHYQHSAAAFRFRPLRKA